jgi:hypothetical protein
VAEGNRPDYPGSAMGRETWTDERLDDLADAMRAGFERVDQDIRQLRQTMLRVGAALMGTQMVGFLSVLAAILAGGA